MGSVGFIFLKMNNSIVEAASALHDLDAQEKKCLSDDHLLCIQHWY